MAIKKNYRVCVTHGHKQVKTYEVNDTLKEAKAFAEAKAAKVATTGDSWDWHVGVGASKAFVLRDNNGFDYAYVWKIEAPTVEGV